MPASTSNENVNEAAMEGSHPAQPAEPGTLKASLLETPGESPSIYRLTIKFMDLNLRITILLDRNSNLKII